MAIKALLFKIITKTFVIYKRDETRLKFKFVSKNERAPKTELIDLSVRCYQNFYKGKINGSDAKDRFVFRFFKKIQIVLRLTSAFTSFSSKLLVSEEPTLFRLFAIILSYPIQNSTIVFYLTVAIYFTELNDLRLENELKLT